MQNIVKCFETTATTAIFSSIFNSTLIWSSAAIRILCNIRIIRILDWT